MNRVIHFEIHASNQDRLQQFYEEVFGWSFQDMGAQMGGYRLVTTGPDGPGINGGMNPRQGNPPVEGQSVNAFVCTIEVEDIDATLEKIEKAGGAVATPKMEVPGIGWLAYRKDPDGNIFGVMEAISKEGSGQG